MNCKRNCIHGVGMTTDEESTKKYPLESITKCVKIGNLQKKNKETGHIASIEFKIDHNKLKNLGNFGKGEMCPYQYELIQMTKCSVIKQQQWHFGALKSNVLFPIRNYVPIINSESRAL
jgi:hypothetical protein